MGIPMLASSAFSILWLICGVIAVLSMLFILGGKQGKSSGSWLRWFHRISGGLFSLGYLVFALSMIPKYQGNAPFLTNSLAFHAFLGAALFPLLFLKHYIVRIAKRYSPSLPYLGMTIIVVTFLVVSFSGINNMILWIKGPKIIVQSSGSTRFLSAAIGRDILYMKCARCHGTMALYKNIKDESHWRSTISRMKRYDKGLYLSEDQIDYIVGYLLLER